MKVDSRSFLESICTLESKNIRGQGGHNKLLLFGNLNVAGTNTTSFRSCLLFLAINQNTLFHCLNKMNKKLGTRIPDCLVGAHEPE
jgi:hypothetical protein